MKPNRSIYLFASMALAALCAGAEPLLWYRFGGSDAVIENVAPVAST